MKPQNEGPIFVAPNESFPAFREWNLSHGSVPTISPERLPWMIARLKRRRFFCGSCDAASAGRWHTRVVRSLVSAGSPKVARARCAGAALAAPLHEPTLPGFVWGSAAPRSADCEPGRTVPCCTSMKTHQQSWAGGVETSAVWFRGHLPNVRSHFDVISWEQVGKTISALPSHVHFHKVLCTAPKDAT